MTVPANPLLDLRDAIVAALGGGDYYVFDAPADAIEPPAYFLSWPEPWLTPLSVCSWRAALDVVCVGARIESASPGYEQIEQLVLYAISQLAAAHIPVQSVGGVAPVEVGQVAYIAARVHLSQSIEP